MAISTLKVVPGTARLVVAWGSQKQYIPYDATQLNELLDGAIPQLLPAPIVGALAAIGYLALGGRHEDVAALLPVDMAKTLAAVQNFAEVYADKADVRNNDSGNQSAAADALGQVSQRPVRSENPITGRWTGRTPSVEVPRINDRSLTKLHIGEHPGHVQLRFVAETLYAQEPSTNEVSNVLQTPTGQGLVSSMRALLWHPESESLQEVHSVIELSVALESGEVVDVTGDPKFEEMYNEQQFAYKPRTAPDSE